MLPVTLCWVSCDGLATHSGGVIILLVTLCWVSCDGLVTHLGGVVTLLVTLCWVPCDGLATCFGGVIILLVTLCWTSCDGLATHSGVVVILLVTLCWVSCDGLAFHLGGAVNAPSHLQLIYVTHERKPKNSNQHDESRSPYLGILLGFLRFREGFRKSKGDSESVTDFLKCSDLVMSMP